MREHTTDLDKILGINHIGWLESKLICTYIQMMDGRNHDNFFKTNALFILYIHVISKGDPITTLLQIQEATFSLETYKSKMFLRLFDTERVIFNYISDQSIFKLKIVAGANDILSEMCRTIGPDRQLLVWTDKILSMPDRLTSNNFPIGQKKYVCFLSHVKKI